MTTLRPTSRIYLAGHRGMVGAAVLRRLHAGGYDHVATATHAELDLCDQQGVRACMARERPEIVIVAAGRVGGIHAKMNAHVLPALLRRCHEAREAGAPQVTLWGSGTPRRELLYVDDCADAIIRLLQIAAPPDWVNVGMGEDVTIRELAESIREVVGYQGELVYDTGYPDGTPRKLVDSQVLRSLGWQPQVGLRDGLRRAYAAYCDELAAGVARGHED